jgi:hypothetical protein
VELSKSIKHLAPGGSAHDVVDEKGEKVDPFYIKHNILPPGAKKRNRRSSFDRVKDLAAGIKDVFTSIPHKEEIKREEATRLAAIIAIKRLVMRKVMVWRREKAASMIQRNFRAYQEAGAQIRWKYLIKLQQKEAAEKADIEVKIQLAAKKEKRAEEQKMKRDAIEAAKVVGCVRGERGEEASAAKKRAQRRRERGEEASAATKRARRRSERGEEASAAKKRARRRSERSDDASECSEEVSAAEKRAQRRIERSEEASAAKDGAQRRRERIKRSEHTERKVLLLLCCCCRRRSYSPDRHPT